METQWNPTPPNRLKRALLRSTALLAILALAVTTGAAFARGVSDTDAHWTEAPERLVAPASAGTLWIFDADFEDMFGDNAGWTTEDLSGTVASVNYWHKDTIHMVGLSYLGDSTWWCGTYDDCWIQPRGYGNNWTCMLERRFPEVEAGTDPGDALTLEWDQRFAMEACYDYGYVEVSADSGGSWATLSSFTNLSCVFHPGINRDWWATEGHVALDLSAYAGETIDIRYRFSSDLSFSSQDEYNNPVTNPCLDGAWQLDNIHLWTLEGEEQVTLFLDDCESPGSNGWVTDDLPASGQTGAVFRRSYEEFDGHSGWMMAAYDTASGRMLPSQDSWLYSPPIYVSPDLGEVLTELVVQCDGWVDLPNGDSYTDNVRLRYMRGGTPECIERHLPDYPYFAWRERDEGPVWKSRSDSLYCEGGGWLGLALQARGSDQTESHGVGFVLDRIRIGAPLQTGLPDGVSAFGWISGVLPNPLGDSATVTYGLPADGHVTLRVFDVAGRAVATLADGFKEPGEHRAVWDGTTDAGERAASGVYFVRLDVDGATRTGTTARKLVLLK